MHPTAPSPIDNSDTRGNGQPPEEQPNRCANDVPADGRERAHWRSGHQPSAARTRLVIVIALATCLIGVTALLDRLSSWCVTSMTYLGRVFGYQ